MKWSFREYLRDVEAVARGLLALGVSPGAAVAVMGFNSPEWFLADLGAVFAGCVSVGIYPTNGPEATRHVVEHSGAEVLVVEGAKELDKIMPYRDQLVGVKAVVQYLGTSGHLTKIEFSTFHPTNIAGVHLVTGLF